MKIYLIRHGESTANLNDHKLISGRQNSADLTKKGRRQVCSLVRYLKRQRIRPSAIYSSTSERAKQSAELLACSFNMQFTALEQLVEIDRGVNENMPRSQVETDDYVNKRNQDNWNFRDPHGESQADVQERMYSCLQRLIRENQGDIAIVGHKMAFCCLLQKIVGFDRENAYRIPIDNASFTVLEYDGNTLRLKDYNRTEHLGICTNLKLLKEQ